LRFFVFDCCITFRIRNNAMASRLNLREGQCANDKPEHEKQCMSFPCHSKYGEISKSFSTAISLMACMRLPDFFFSFSSSRLFSCRSVVKR